jgi:hypothetical protein
MIGHVHADFGAIPSQAIIDLYIHDGRIEIQWRVVLAKVPALSNNHDSNCEGE